MSILPAQHPAGKPPRGALTAGSLCTGYGGLDLAVMAVTGARLAWCAETDRYAAAVLARHWPGVPNLGDVTALDWATVPPVDLVSAGWPCQDISYAGPGPASRKEPAVACGSPSPTAFAVFDPATSSWRTSPRSARAGSGKSSATWPRSGMTRNGSAYALPTPEPRTAATASCSSPSGPAQPHGSRLLPTPVAGNYDDGAYLTAWQARRDRQKKPGRNGNGTGTPLPAAIALLPTPMAGDFGADRSAGPVRPSGAKRQTGLPDVIIHRLAGQGGAAGAGEPGAGRLLPTPDTGCSPNGHGRRAAGPATGTRAARASTSRPPPSRRRQRPARARPRGRSTSRRSAAGRASSGAPRRRPPSRGRQAGPGCRPRSPSG